MIPTRKEAISRLEDQLQKKKIPNRNFTKNCHILTCDPLQYCSNQTRIQRVPLNCSHGHLPIIAAVTPALIFLWHPPPMVVYTIYTYPTVPMHIYICFNRLNTPPYPLARAAQSSLDIWFAVFGIV